MIFGLNIKKHCAHEFCCLLLFSPGHCSPLLASPAFVASFHTICLLLPAKVLLGVEHVWASHLNDGEEAFIKALTHVGDRKGDSINLRVQAYSCHPTQVGRGEEDWDIDLKATTLNNEHPVCFRGKIHPRISSLNYCILIFTFVLFHFSL